MEADSPWWLVIGYGALLISCTAFGCMFVPLRNKKTKDGFFVQWIECAVVFIAGCIIYSARGFPTFEPVAAIGGVLYATGNVFSVPIINGIGMGVGFLVWSSLQILVGWGVARFGLFDLIAPQPVKDETLNYIGISLTLISGILLVFVNKSEPKESEKEFDDSETNRYVVNASEDDEESTGITSLLKKIPFLLMACALAIMHGVMMAPIDYLKQRNPSTDQFKIFDYIFPFYTSVFLFSTVYFLGYALIRGSRSHVDYRLIGPSIAYGVLWTTGMTLWFLSSDRLSQVVAYPITTRLPPLISALIDVVIFRNIKDKSSLLALTAAALFAIAGVVLIAISNEL